MNSHDLQIVQYIGLAQLALTQTPPVTRAKFVGTNPDAYKESIMGQAYDAAKAILFAKDSQVPTISPGGKALTLGIGVTMSVGSDRYAYSLCGWTPNGRTVYIRPDTATRTDKNGLGGAQEYSYIAQPDALPVKATWSPKRKRYIANGSPIAIGTRSAYQDPSF